MDLEIRLIDRLGVPYRKLHGFGLSSVSQGRLLYIWKAPGLAKGMIDTNPWAGSRPMATPYVPQARLSNAHGIGGWCYSEGFIGLLRWGRNPVRSSLLKSLKFYASPPIRYYVDQVHGSEFIRAAVRHDEDGFSILRSYGWNIAINNKVSLIENLCFLACSFGVPLTSFSLPFFSFFCFLLSLC